MMMMILIMTMMTTMNMVTKMSIILMEMKYGYIVDARWDAHPVDPDTDGWMSEYRGC